MKQQIVTDPEFIANPDYTGQMDVYVDKRYCPETGTPLVSIQFVMPDGEATPIYQFDVPTAENIARALLTFASEHRQKHPPECFAEEVS